MENYELKILGIWFKVLFIDDDGKRYLAQPAKPKTIYMKLDPKFQATMIKDERFEGEY